MRQDKYSDIMIKNFYCSCFQDELGYVEDEFEDLKELFKVGRTSNEYCALFSPQGVANIINCFIRGCIQI